MTKDVNEELEEKSQGILDSMMQTLGIVEIIIGGCLCYWIYLAYGSAVTSQFPSTGFEFIDYVLLGFASAVTGKIVTIFAYVIMGLCRIIFFKDQKNEIKRISDLMLPGTQKRNTIDTGVEILAHHQPLDRKSYEKSRSKVITTLSLTLLALLYFDQFRHMPISFGIKTILFISILLLLALGYWELSDSIKRLTLSLQLLEKKLPPPAPVNTQSPQLPTPAQPKVAWWKYLSSIFKK